MADSLSTFPEGLRVLVVDDDLTCLQCLSGLLQACHYQVTKCQRATDAVTLLRERENEFDIVISDIYMPDMNGFQLLEIIRLEMDLPVVVMSDNDSKDVVMKAIKMGACDYLVKPVRQEEISVIWQHVVRKQKRDLKSMMLSKMKPTGELEYQNKSSPEEENCGSSNNNNVKMDEEEGFKNDVVSMKKSRMVWTTELHEQFVAAVNDIGLKNAVPKRILELMKVAGLTRENVASHLQKYRIYLRRKTENTQKKLCKPSTQIQNPYMVGSSNSSQAYAISNQLHSQSSVVSQAEAERFGAVANGVQGNCYNHLWYYGRQVNLQHDSHGLHPTVIESENQDEFAMMQKDEALNVHHYSLPVMTSHMAQNDYGNNLSTYECSSDGTDQNASFETVRNYHPEYALSCSGYESVFFSSTL